MDKTPITANNLNRREYVDYITGSKTGQISDYHVLRIGRNERMPSGRFGPLVHPYHMLCFFRKGKGSLEIDGRRLDFGPNDVLLIPAEKMSLFNSASEQPVSYMWIAFTGTRSDQIVTQLRRLFSGEYVSHNLPIEDYEAAFLKGVSLSGNTNYNYFMAIGVLLEIFALLSRDLHAQVRSRKQGNEPSSLAYDIKHFFDMNYTDKLFMHQVAQKYCIHPNYMNLLFKKTFGVSPKHYVLTLKREKACELLSETDLPILMIAQSIGFSDQLSFSKFFHTMCSTSPSRYRIEQKKAKQENRLTDNTEDLDSSTAGRMEEQNDPQK